MTAETVLGAFTFLWYTAAILSTGALLVRIVVNERVVEVMLFGTLLLVLLGIAAAAAWGNAPHVIDAFYFFSQELKIG